MIGNNSRKPYPSPHWSKDFVAHIRTVNFPLLAGCLALIGLLSVLQSARVALFRSWQSDGFRCLNHEPAEKFGRNSIIATPIACSGRAGQVSVVSGVGSSYRIPHSDQLSHPGTLELLPPRRRSESCRVVARIEVPTTASTSNRAYPSCWFWPVKRTECDLLLTQSRKAGKSWPPDPIPRLASSKLAYQGAAAFS
jgi:hypothetical protein